MQTVEINIMQIMNAVECKDLNHGQFKLGIYYTDLNLKMM
jgi:hypothetical protein